MRFRMTAVACTCALALAAAVPALAHGEEESGQPDLGAYARNLAFVGGRAVDLMEAIPADSYGWRPMEGVRSVSEAAMHMASANYFFASRLGTAVPEGVEMGEMEKITDKEKVVATLKASLDHLTQALDNIADLGAEMDIFGRQGTAEDMLLIAVSHVHEHFGQLIAYARSNQIAPPWSQPQEG